MEVIQPLPRELLQQATGVYQMLQNEYDIVRENDWCPSEVNTHFLDDQTYWAQVYDLGGEDMVQWLQGIESPCMTWSEGDPVVYFNIDMIPSSELDIRMAEEFLHASGARVPLTIPFWKEQNPEVAMRFSSAAMEQCVVYLACHALGIVDYPYMPKTILPHLQEDVNHSAIIGRIIGVGADYDPNIIARMCTTGDISEFSRYFNHAYSVLADGGNMDPATQLLTLEGMYYHLEDLPEGHLEREAAQEMINTMVGLFLDAYTHIYKARGPK